MVGEDDAEVLERYASIRTEDEVREREAVLRCTVTLTAFKITKKE